MEERIGDVNTGLTEETILKCIKQQSREKSDAISQMDPEPCCICQVSEILSLWNYLDNITRAT